jgi:hypothetical protein
MTYSTDEWYSIAEVWKQARIGAPQVVSNLVDLQQCIETILRTYPGQDALRPFGSRILDHIDLPINTARPLIIRDAIDAIALWEPRVNVQRVVVEGNAAKGELLLTVYWTVKDSTTSGEATITLRSAIT